MVFITAIHLSGGRSHEHITEVRWQNPQTGETDRSSTASMVDWIDNQNGTAKVRGGNGASDIPVGTVHPAGRAAYLRTYADGAWTNNLLELPTY